MIVCGLGGLLCLLLVLRVGVFNFALFVGLCLFGWYCMLRLLLFGLI